MDELRLSLLITIFVSYLLLVAEVRGREAGYISAVGDPGMARDGLRLALEAWNFCNEVGAEAPNMGSPRLADCFDLDRHGNVVHRVKERDNRLSAGDEFEGGESPAVSDVDLYAVEKELYLGRKCEVTDQPRPWQFWMVMLKNGNLDTGAGLCPKDGRRVGPFPPEARFPCFGKGCMNQPLVFHQPTKLEGGGKLLKGRFYGSYDLDADDLDCGGGGGRGRNRSFYSVKWEKEVGKGGWRFHHELRTSKKYPWLMLYLRSDATAGFSGGYHYETRGMTKIVPESPDFKVRVTLDIKRGGGRNSQFYLMDMGSCWKNSGEPCDGDVTTDVTRYSEMIINPETEAWCRPDQLHECPPWHTFPDGTRVHRTNTTAFPYDAYHVYCAPGNARQPEEPYRFCDQYSNPQPQEILQILPHPVWGEYGYPTKKGEGWVGDPRTWELDVGRMSQNLFFYQELGTPPAKRQWTSLDVGTEIYKSEDGVAAWTLSGFDILVPGSTKAGESSRLIKI